ncbi:family 16 glycosylhydrolase [Flavihumibacter sp. UBA7668]|uniref:family 16 glycosylhydrolase n=1 Tax=Flavihumibacter sp. UBA7668 TaxID=1946542 RepID=UPI0025C06E2C|nr:family 16 glycosylhydrolase [Flavihumibacter sp. UBA7668]
MRTIMNTLLLATYLLVATSCSKDDESTPANGLPAKLTISADITTDGSGLVKFKASAQNASSYFFEFGNGITQTDEDGELEHTYSTSGNNLYIVTVKASNAAGDLTKSTQIRVNVASTEPGLVWSDEFNSNGAPDPSKWDYNIGTGDNGWGNQELQYYTNRAENAVVTNGVLRITAQKENYNGSAYTSARLLSKGKFTMKYGRVEVSAKMPEGVGTWPAIWMLGANIDQVNWPACGEIDIMEHLGRDLNNIYGTFHYPGRFGGNADGGTRRIENATTEFHKYSMEWRADKIQLFVDDQLIHTLNNSPAVPFNHEFFFILNVAMGGNFPGPVDPAFTSASMEIDYIRVYE